MWCTIPASAFLRRLVALSTGLLVAILLALLVGALPMAHATHEPVCLDDENDARHATNTPTPENDVIEGTDGKDVLVGGWGDDVINGKGGFDVLCGNEGDDRIRGGGDAF